MSNTQFIDKQTVVATNWLQDVNDLTYSIGNKTDPLKGAGMVGWFINLAGFVGRWVSDKLAERRSVDDFNADPTGGEDSYAAIQAAINSFSSGGRGVLHLGSGGDYKVSAMLNNNNRNIIIKGNGATLTLTANADYLLYLDGSGCRVENLQLDKDAAVVAVGAARIAGIRHRFSDVQCFEQKWANVFDLWDCKESHFTNIRVDNDSAVMTGNVFRLNYSVNNTVSDSMVGFCSKAFHLTAAVHPIYGNKNEGLGLSNIITVYSDAVVGDNITALHLTNCILDFCINVGVSLTNGHTATISGGWVAGSAASGFTGVQSGTNFSNVNITDLTLVGNGTLGSSIAYSINSPDSSVRGGTIDNLLGGIVNYASSYIFGIKIKNGGTQPTGDHGFIPGLTKLTDAAIAGTCDAGLFKSAGIREFTNFQINGNGIAPSYFGDSPTQGDLYASEVGTNNYVRAVFSKGGSSNTVLVTTLASSGLSIGGTNSAGTITINGATVPDNLRVVAKISSMVPV